jgi:(p)ppGpp synthase/HD superfamily hydrolase
MDAGYSQTDLSFIFGVYQYSSQLNYGFQSSGKPFITHLIRTASILVRLKMDIAVIAAGLIHSAYEYSDFGDGSRGISQWKRQQLRQKAGELVEIYVMKYYF